MYTFVPNKPLGSLLENSPENHIFLKTFNSEFQGIRVWITDQNSQALEIEDRINLTPVIKWYSHYKNEVFNWRACGPFTKNKEFENLKKQKMQTIF